MPRKPRMYLPDVPAHIVQRGNNRDAVEYTWVEGVRPYNLHVKKN